jgi:hypothetical protein
MIKRVLHWIIIVVSIAVLLVSTVVVVLTLQRDKIIAFAVEALNDQLKVQVSVQKMDLTFLKTFPDVSLRLRDCSVQGNQAAREEPLAFIRTLDLRFDVLLFLQGEYTIESIVLDNGEIVLFTDANGKHNFTDLVRSNSSDSANVLFNLKDIRLRSTTITYEQEGKIYGSLFIQRGNLSLQKHTNGYDIHTTLAGNTERIQIQDQVFLLDQTVQLNTDILYTTKDGLLSFQEGLLKLRDAEILVRGKLETSGKGGYDFQVQVPSLTLTELMQMMPAKVASTLKAYNFTGALELKGNIRSKDSKLLPMVSGRISLLSGGLSHADLPERIEKLEITATLQNKAPYDLGTYELIVPKLTTGINGEIMEMNGTIQNFLKPTLKGTIKGKYPAAKLSVLLDPKSYRMTDGAVEFDISFEKPHQQPYQMEGEVLAKNIVLYIAELKDTVHIQKGTCMLNGEDVAFTNTAILYRGQSVRLNGIVYDLMKQSAGKELKVVVYLESDDLIVDSLFSKDLTGSSKPVALPALLVVSAKMKVQRLRYQKHYHRGVSMRVYMDSSQVFVEELTGSIGNGTIDAELHLRKINQELFNLSILAKAEKVPVDSIFYMRENFGQKFLTSKHLSGQLNSTIRLHCQLDHTMQPILSTLLVGAGVEILNGRLYQFEPMKALAKYTDEQALQDIRFNTLSNTIHIEKGIVYIPEMSIGSNIREITLAGRHGFDQTMNYTIRVPVSKKKTADSDERFGALEEAKDGGLFLYLKVSGTPDNMQIAYDKKAVKNKIGERLKEEKKEMIRLFKPSADTLRKKTTPVQPEEDTYFDFD